MPTLESTLLLTDAIWIAVALLHQEFPNRDGFTRAEIRTKLRDTGLSDGLKPSSIAAHLSEHMVANVPPSSTKYQMLFKLGEDKLRLYMPGDALHPKRASSRPNKQRPSATEIPDKYLRLLSWYIDWCTSKPRESPAPLNFDDDPFIRLIGSGRETWADEHADEYVENLRREDR